MSNSTSNSVSFVFNPDDNRPLPEIIAEQAGFKLAYLDHENGNRYYAVQDWIEGIALTDEPRVFWAKLKKRLAKAQFELFPPCQQLPYYAANGRIYQMDYAQAETLYQITQRMDSQTGLRDKVLRYLAQAGVVIDEMRIDPEQALEVVIAFYKRMGKSDSWINTRIKSKLVRIHFTEKFAQSQHTPPKPKHYGIITDTMRKGLWKRDTATIKAQLKLRKQDNPRDHFSELALTYEMLAEQISAKELSLNRDLDFDAANAIVRTNSESVGDHAEATGRRLGIDIVTDKPLLKDKNQ